MLIRPSSPRAQDVRAYAPAGVPAAAPPAPRPEEARIAALKAALEAALAGRDAAIEARDAALADLAPKSEEAREQGFEAGRRAGEAEAAESLRRLEEGIAAARAGLDEALVGLEGVAALCAETCLERMFGAAGARGEAVRDLLAHQLKRLEGRAILKVRVSPADFDTDALAALAGMAGCEVAVDDGLDPGGCTIVLALGTMEIGLDRQWSGLRAVLAELAGAETGA